MKEYRIKDEKFRKLAQEIANYSVGGDIPLEYFISKESSGMRKRLIEYGVFDLWFEEIRFKSKDYIYILDSGNIYQIEDCEVIGEILHWNAVEIDKGWAYRFCSPLNNIRHATKEEIEESKFKSGDYIYTTNIGKTYQIEDCEVIGNELHWNTVGEDIEKGDYSFSTLLSNIRHATKSEIEKYNQQLPDIDWYKGKIDGDYIVYGCKRIYIQDFIKLYEACMGMDVAVDSIEIGGYKVEMETIKEIYEKIHTL